MYCKECSSYINDDMVFCPMCGAQVEPDAVPSGSGNAQPAPNPSGINRFTNGNDIRCINCGGFNQPGNIYCNNCGAPLVSNNQSFSSANHKKRLNGAAIALICIGAAALIGCAIVALIIFGPFGSDIDDSVKPSETATEAAETEEPTERPTSRPTPEPDDYSDDDRNYSYVPSYDYYSKTDSAHSFICDYPSDFSVITPPADHKWVTYALSSPDGTGFIYIGGAGGKTAEKTASDFINTAGNGGTVLVNDQSDGAYCRVKTKNSSGCHYAYFDLTGSQLRGFEVHYDSDQDARYSRYISHMENALYCY